jgi:hypothetical protein
MQGSHTFTVVPSCWLRFSPVILDRAMLPRTCTQIVHLFQPPQLDQTLDSQFLLTYLISTLATFHWHYIAPLSKLNRDLDELLLAATVRRSCKSPISVGHAVGCLGT